ncbi:MAG: ABC-F family ATP-binding cassette domain-containing protein, partial [Gammaproteobacteria bacterium]
VALSKILMQEPDVLFLDEPTNHLDLEATIWLEKFLASWKGGMVLISHDRTFLDRSINHIIEIDLKRIKIYKGTYSDFLKNKKIEMELYLNEYKNQQTEKKETEKLIERFRYKNTKATQVQSRIKKLEKLEILEEPSEDNSSIRLKIPQPKRSPLRVVSCENVGKSYGDVEVFNDLKFVVERENKIGLVGVNGAGKSTLLKMLAGVEKASTGTFKYGQNIKVSYYAQHQLETLEENDTVYGSIEKFALGMTETQIRTYLGGFLFSGEEIEKKVKVLSGGEKARLALGRMLLEPSNLLLLDEPTNHLDMVSRSIVEEAMASFQGSIVCISHDRHFLNKITNIICEVGNGGVITYQGNYEYYEWKKKQKQNEDSSLVKHAKNKKKDYQLRKQSKNRIAWINKRFKQIEREIKHKESLLHDEKNKSNATVLNEVMEEISQLENEYFQHVEELDKLN